MSYTFEKGKMYRMPTHFGPRTGPRQGERGQKFENRETPKTTTVGVSFLSNWEQLERLLPECYEPVGDPVVTVYVSYMTEIEWLAGRGYNMLGVLIPAAFIGEKDQVSGQMMTVLWENLADPIITGREELGFAKIYCDIPEPVVMAGGWHCSASWMGFKFLDIEVSNLTERAVKQAPLRADRPDKGILHYKYVPRTGEWGTADVEYPTFTPESNSSSVLKEEWTGDGVVRFHPARWEEMPTQYNIVNRLHELEIRKYLGGSVRKVVGSKDLSNQRILR